MATKAPPISGMRLQSTVRCRELDGGFSLCSGLHVCEQDAYYGSTHNKIIFVDLLGNSKLGGYSDNNRKRIATKRNQVMTPATFPWSSEVTEG